MQIRSGFTLGAICYTRMKGRAAGPFGAAAKDDANFHWDFT